MMLVWKLWKSALESLPAAPPAPRSGRIPRRAARRTGVPPGRPVSSPRNDAGLGASCVPVIMGRKPRAGRRARGRKKTGGIAPAGQALMLR